MKVTEVRTDFLRTGRTLLRIFTDEGVGTMVTPSMQRTPAKAPVS